MKNLQAFHAGMMYHAAQTAVDIIEKAACHYESGSELHKQLEAAAIMLNRELECYYDVMTQPEVTE
jgi:hypothetical protein